jgi:hypothetical protein
VRIVVLYKLYFHLLLLQHSLLPGGIILQGVLLLQGSMSVFYVPLGLAANVGLKLPSTRFPPLIFPGFFALTPENCSMAVSPLFTKQISGLFLKIQTFPGLEKYLVFKTFS